MPDETTNTDIPVATEAPVEAVVAEPTIVAEPEPVAVVEPVVESASLGTPEEFPAIQIDAFPGASLSENISSPVVETVAEMSIVAEQPVVAEIPVAIEPVPAIDASVEPTAVEPVTAIEQPAPVAPESAAPQSGDLGLTPQTVQFEALKSEIPPKISPIEQVHVPVVPAQPASTTVPPIVQPLNIFLSLISKGRATIQVHKRKKLNRIMDLFAKKAQNGSTSSPQVTNDDVEKLLHISDATASRYLGILEKEGKVKRVGTAGRWVSYVKV